MPLASALLFSSSSLPPSNSSPSPHHHPLRPIPFSRTISSSSSSELPCSSSPPPSLTLGANFLNSITPASLNTESSLIATPSPEKPWMQGPSIKMPTAPWMRGPLLVPAEEFMDVSKTRRKKKKIDDSIIDRSLNDKVPGGKNRANMRSIMRSITKLRRLVPLDAVGEDERAVGEVEEMEFSIPLEKSVGDGKGEQRSRKVPWMNVEEKIVYPKEKKERVATTAERVLPKMVLNRLREEARRMGKWVKAKKAGVTQEVVDEIRRTWKRSELAMVKFRLPLSRNMERAREIMEIKTGGLVVWSKKDALVVYGGSHHQFSQNAFRKITSACRPSLSVSSSGVSEDNSPIIPADSSGITNATIIQRDAEAKQASTTYMTQEGKTGLELVGETLFERETNRLLDGLGPRFIDWWWRKPLPVDADLLPEVVPNFRPPYRRCPPQLRPTLADDELTYLRKLAKPLPTHFALGKNRKLQGLAVAIIKLWKKCPVAKIAVKRGIQNTKNEQMSYELKRLTGGTLILRNKFFIILYRGKDFLPDGVVNSIIEREIELSDQQLQEEAARSMAIELCRRIDSSTSSTNNAGTLSEFEDIRLNYPIAKNDINSGKVHVEAEQAKLEKELREQQHKLFILEKKIERSEKELSALNSSWRLSEADKDQELLTEEEKRNLQKIGLKMDEFLLLGRRGIYDGVIASIHQHWKHREVVKVITMQKTYDEATYTARTLEIESGGILVAVKQLRKGHVILIYRGKNYRRPIKLLPENLLTKKEAWQRSIELQRRGSLKFFAHQRRRTIWKLQMQLRKLEEKIKKPVPGVCQDPSVLRPQKHTQD